MTLVTKKFTFEACHHLPNYVGACHNIHGHSYKLEISLCGNPSTNPQDEKFGMVMDFKDLKKIVEDNILSKYDHSDLNKYFKNPTAEVMVKHIAYEIMEIMSEMKFNASLFRARLWETEDSYADFYPFEFVIKDLGVVI